MVQSSDGEAGRIVAGIDGSPSSLEALAWAARQADLTAATLEIVTAWDWPDTFGWAPALPAEYNPEAEAGELLHQRATELQKEYPNLTITERLMQGHPAPSLVEASEHAALLVVGNRGHGEFAGMLLGSVSQHCAASAHCPVLVYRTSDDS
jgi:nucleotide-binding universal stress UspA family protein